MARPFHFFGMYGMGGHFTDPGEDAFTARVKQTFPDINCHESPYNDQQAGEIAALIDDLPPDDGVLVQGTSLGANNTPVACGYTKHTIDGAFGFQASLYGYHSSLTANVKFAFLFYSFNPSPWPGLGAYIWRAGTMSPLSFHSVPHHIPHPGDYDVGDQNTLLGIIGRIKKT